MDDGIEKLTDEQLVDLLLRQSTEPQELLRALSDEAHDDIMLKCRVAGAVVEEMRRRAMERVPRNNLP